MKEFEKIFFGGLDMLRGEVNTPIKMPRTCVIPVIRDKKRDYLNAAPYSGGVTNIKPLHILFGPKTKTTIETFGEIDEFVVAIPEKKQLNETWTTGLGVPAGISEIEIAGWNPLESQVIETPGIQECPINLECRKVFYEKLPDPWRAVVVGEVVGINIDSSLLKMKRSEVVKKIPIHESTVNHNTGLYGPSVLSGELIPELVSQTNCNNDYLEEESKDGKIFIEGEKIYEPQNQRILSNAIFPRPSYFLMTTDKKGNPNVLPICGGKLQSSVPTLTIPVPKNSYSYDNIKENGELLIAIPDRSLIANFEEMEKNIPSGFKSAGLTLLNENMVRVKGIRECPLNVDYKVVMFKDVPGHDYAIVNARRVGVSYTKEVFDKIDNDWPHYKSIKYLNELYSTYLYAVMDEKMNRKWGFHDPNPLSVRPLPSWGTRYGTTWTGSKNLNYWLIELVQENLIDPRDLNKISTNLMLWNDGTGQKHLEEYYTKEYFKELQEKLTKLFKMMAWAHRDFTKWEEVREYINTFPAVERDPFDGPILHETWDGKKVYGMNLLQGMLK